MEWDFTFLAGCWRQVLGYNILTFLIWAGQFLSSLLSPASQNEVKLHFAFKTKKPFLLTQYTGFREF